MTRARDDARGESHEVKRLDTIERGDDELRISWDEFVPERGSPSRYVSIRVWWCGQDDEWHPTRKGITVRRNELERVREALTRVIDGLARQESQQ